MLSLLSRVSNTRTEFEMGGWNHNYSSFEVLLRSFNLPFIFREPWTMNFPWNLRYENPYAVFCSKSVRRAQHAHKLVQITRMLNSCSRDVKKKYRSCGADIILCPASNLIKICDETVSTNNTCNNPNDNIESTDTSIESEEWIQTECVPISRYHVQGLDLILASYGGRQTRMVEAPRHSLR